MTRPRASLEIADVIALADPHLRHETGTLSMDIRDENHAPIPAPDVRPVGDTAQLYDATVRADGDRSMAPDVGDV